MTERETLRQALEALEKIDDAMPFPVAKFAQRVLREALEQPTQDEPVAWFDPEVTDRDVGLSWTPGQFHTEPLYTRPQPVPTSDTSQNRVDEIEEQRHEPLTSQERDAQRWRFLMENSYDSESVTQFHVWEHSWEPHSQTGKPTEWKQRVRGIALIDFIDRAIEAVHGIGEKK
jgi:hypothetical protein